ncbi:hypothetical protein GLOTRDRAFT_120643 [Gloeophyllum trabeum ATCC 11539]|uniref:P-loop containing nucleoside triphosphate hydrolase protein n=1 Tax=Gloeophyllum trabeum (strain ATCC 11539 / FP-39264 / Madison 617) TaxID=670483 RepID=S7QC69_GLOTA|nr:uncharacterized protein GLOTRDRAFT_120643 [Gloeophyllum trabeum ATCC 11539]EPQ57486.1 hypothetical protein GLOTRDRAFT_120643 [Gloeophyllum trabeum ATCC 11539]
MATTLTAAAVASYVSLTEALYVVRVVSPALVLLATLALIPTRPAPPRSPSEITSVVVATRVPRRGAILSLLSLSALTFFLDGLTFAVYALLNKIWPQNTGIEIGAVIGLVAFGGLAALGAWKDVKGVDVWSLKRVKLAIAVALLLDIAQVVLFGLSVRLYKDVPKIPELPLKINLPALLHLVFPALRVLFLVPLLFALVYPRVVYTPVSFGETVHTAAPDSSSLLLSAEEGATTSTGLSPVTAKTSQYGTFRSGRSITASSGPTTRTNTPARSDVQLPTVKSDAGEKQDVNLDPSWREIWKRLGRITPYLWPTKSFALQLLATLCLLLIIVGRFVNAALPLILGSLLHVFESGKGSPWPYLFAYVGLRFLQGSGGLAALRDVLWAPVMQYSDREMSQLSFDHLLNLSLAFHTRRKTGEVLRILDRGSAINRTFELLLFNIFPTFFDLIIALGIFIWKFEWSLAVVIFIVMFLYVVASVVLTRWRTKLRRQMNERDIVTRGIHTDCLLNYETVKYFNGEQHEGQRYREAIRQYQALEFKVIASLNLLNLVQNLLITSGLLVGALIVALHVTRGELYPSDFIIFITYLGQLYGPLNSLGYIYRSVNQSLVDAERLLRLLNEPVDVNDKPNAPDLIVTGGEIEFDNVNFSYDGRTTALNGVSFKVPRGSSVALVGESGSGKSTVLRLLYRFYDLKDGEGRILIDGQDIRDVTQSSLRKAIGVVPQDSVLFNDTIAYNIGYGKMGASMEEIEAAARSAQMHERIMSFPDGYETKVGERGVRLSGGEKQRVAIARTLLKNPPILLLDEATSALDTSTEKDIQKALQNLVQGRSSLSIAHRLSTIASADLILVLKDGQIVEHGTHSELLAHGGVFASMWADQVSGTEDNVTIGSTKEAVAGYSVDGQEEPSKSEVVAEDIPATNVADVEASEPAAEASAEVHATIEDQGDHIEPKEEQEAIAVADASDAAATSANVVEATSDVAVPDDTSRPAAFEFPASKGPAPVAFPTSDETASQQTPSVAEGSAAQSPGVTFVPTVGSPPSRSGTPDPDAEPKRKRISSQNFQRLARRISISRRQGSTGSIIPGLRREQSSPAQTPKDEAHVATGSGDSPSPSIQSESGKGKAQKKEKKRKTIF